MNRLRSSDFLSDLYRDLRDKRLLLPIAVLLVAIVALPFVLRGGSEAAVPPPSVAPPVEAESAQSAVLADSSGIRDYRKRLAALKKKNPFEQQYAEVEAGDQLAPPAGGSGSAGGSSEPLSTSLDDATAAGAAGGGDGSASSVAPSPSSDPPPAPAPVAKPPKVKWRFYTHRADVTIGPLGETRKINGVKRFALLPEENAPVVAFLGATTGGKRGVFMVSPDVERSDGDGICSPKSPAPCSFLTMKIGGQRYLHYEPDGLIYRLKLRDIEVHRISNPQK